MINYALNHGIDRYNFYGVSGKFTEDAEDAGVVKFKKVTMLKLLNMLVTLLNQLINLFTQHIPHLKVKDRILGRNYQNMKFTELTVTEFDNFVQNPSLESHYFQVKKI